MLYSPFKNQEESTNVLPPVRFLKATFFVQLR